MGRTLLASTLPWRLARGVGYAVETTILGANASSSKVLRRETIQPRLGAVCAIALERKSASSSARYGEW